MATNLLKSLNAFFNRLEEEAFKPRCCFCGEQADDDSVMDSNGAIACRSCGEAEYAAQKAEGFR